MFIPVVSSTVLPSLELPPDEVHIWHAALDTGAAVLQSLEETLAPDEKDRAERFVFKRHRDRFITARGILRELLAAYLHCSPVTFEFNYGPHGKPALRTQDPKMRLCFNLSHSQSHALYAFAYRREVGIDLELIRADFGGQEIAERFFSPREFAELRALPAKVRPEGFFNCWTRKEAYLKARGDGFHTPLDSFSVSLRPGEQAVLNSPDCSRWSLHSFQTAQRFIAAVVVEGRDCHLRHFERRLPSPTTVLPTSQL